MNTEKQNQGQSGNIHIIINGRQHSVESDAITYSELVSLAFPSGGTQDALYSIMYSGPNIADGSLAKGGSVSIKNGLKFDVSLTNRS